MLIIPLVALACLTSCQVNKHVKPSTSNNSINSAIETDRLKTYAKVSNALALLSDKALLQLLETNHAQPSFGGTKISLSISGVPVFAKKIKLTSLEMQSQNRHSTSNVFNLPPHYQFNYWSLGFGAWRELAANIMATNWVLSGECQNFPMMYHWRILPCQPKAPKDILSRKEIFAKLWNNNPAVLKRVNAIDTAPTEIVLFLESIPQTLQMWLEEKLRQNEAAAFSTITKVDQDLQAIISFINTKGLLHCDLNFINVLTDGNRLYLTDFGLAMSAHFELSQVETDFFNKHQKLDRYEASGYLALYVMGCLFGMQNADINLHEYVQGKSNKAIAPWATDILNRYARIATVKDKFMEKFATNKTTPFPIHEFEAAEKTHTTP